MFLLVPAYPGSPGQKAVKRLCVCVCVRACVRACVRYRFIWVVPEKGPLNGCVCVWLLFGKNVCSIKIRFTVQSLRDN